MVLGTAAYMSPEQVRGEAVDHRSDIFSFGAVLHEMLTGRQAFGRETATESMTAILREDPPEIATAGSGASPGLQRITQHCLEKKPGERFQSTRDIAFALQALSGSALASGPTVAVTNWNWRRWLAFGGGLLAIAGALAAGVLVGRSKEQSGPSRITRLTFQRGQVDAARFAPDGQTIVYSASWNGSPYEVFSTRLGSTESRPLGFPASVLAGVSASGEMALLRNVIPWVVGQPTSQVGMLASAPLAGGPAHDREEGIQFAEWSPDGKQLAVVTLPGWEDPARIPDRACSLRNGWLDRQPPILSAWRQDCVSRHPGHQSRPGRRCGGRSPRRADRPRGWAQDHQRAGLVARRETRSGSRVGGPTFRRNSSPSRSPAGSGSSTGR